MLGMPHGTANGRLLKAMLFCFAARLGLTNCFRCGNQILTGQEFTVEHKDPWENSPDAKRLFFDLENIAFSHDRCNAGAARRRKLHMSEADRSRKRRIVAKAKRLAGTEGVEPPTQGLEVLRS